MATELLFNKEDIQNKMEEEVDSKLNDFADLVFEFSQDNLIEAGTIDEGTLLKSGQIERRFLEKDVGYSAPYAAAMEVGTEPHMPPVDAIEGWVKRKLGVSGKEARSVAWAVAKTIERDGLEPRSYMKGAVEKAIGVADSGGL